MVTRFYSIKDEVRVLGLDDGPFKRDDSDVLVVGAVFRGGSFMDGVISTRVSVDGLDSTARLAEVIGKTRFRDLRVIMLDGIAFGGFNVVDINRLCEETGLPVIVVTRNMPDFREIRRALMNLRDGKDRYRLMEDAGEPKPVETRDNKFVYIQAAGINFKDAEEIVRLSSTRSLIPEPIRVAHLIAQGVVSGESKGKA
ncbi:MAG: DUF99 family protein [Candidatus Altiarchaeales archaeon]|nr:DUF99 family protein [Candidatus Altiarchaeales archaeon]MBD3416906.1 DUF99 family protein [Candidatus Altiarchaeales archaeon]